MNRDTWVAGFEGRLCDYLNKIPITEWNKHHVHAACLSEKNLHALRLLLCARVEIPWIATYEAARRGDFAMVELFCAAGADVCAEDVFGETPLQATFRSASGNFRLTARVLVVNGVRASTMPRKWKNYHGGMRIHKSAWNLIDLIMLERHVDTVRRIVVALFCAKAACRLARWDKFLLKEIALQVWADRTNEDSCS